MREKSKGEDKKIMKGKGAQGRRIKRFIKKKTLKKLRIGKKNMKGLDKGKEHKRERERAGNE